MNPKELVQALTQIQTFLRDEGGSLVSKWSNFSIINSKDEGADPTTDLDIQIESKFYDLVSKFFPEHGFFGEELSERRRQAEYTWYIDPIDGTKYFVNQIPLWGSSIALLHNNKPILGVIYNPVTQQMLSAIKDQGAFLNEKRLQLRPSVQLSTSQIAWDFINQREGMKGYSAPELNESIYAIRHKLCQQAYRVREIGSGMYSLAWMAQGHFAGYISLMRKIDKFADIAAGILIAQEAGARVIRTEVDIDRENILVSHPELSVLLQKLTKF